MKRARLLVAACPFLFSIFILAQTPDPAVSLKLLPAPKEVRMGEGAFTITESTRIVSESSHAAEDRTAVETLQAEIERQGGPKVPVVTGRESKKSSKIILGRISDPGLSANLATSGLKADTSLGEQGY